MKRKIIYSSVLLVIVTIIIILIFVKSDNNKFQIESFNSSSSTFSQWMQKAIEETGSSISDLNVTSLDIDLIGSEPSFISLTTKDVTNGHTVEFQINPNDNIIIKDDTDFQSNEDVPMTSVLEFFSVADIYNITSTIDSTSKHITLHFSADQFNARDIAPDSLIVYKKTIYKDVEDLKIETDAYDYCIFDIAGENESYFIYFLYEPNS